jgi:hypothetical protein
VKGLLIDGPAAGKLIDAGEPPARRGVIVCDDHGDGFGEVAARYYLSSVDDGRAAYRFGGNVSWPPEASLQMVRERSESRPAAPDRVPVRRPRSGR